MRAQEFIQEVKARYEMTDLDPWTFDQTPAGWRGLPSSARQADALNQYIDRYVKDGQFVGAPQGVKTVRPYILYWHLGQVLTQMGRNGMAARVMRQALDDSDPNWNAYVMATVSFLRKDRKDFDYWAPLARGNEETIKRLTDGWGQPYKQAYAGQQGVAEGPENNTTAQKIFFARSNIAPKSWSYDHVGFITQDGKQIQMSGHRGNDVYVTNDVTDDPAFPKQNIKIVSLSKPVSVPTTNSIGAENCGTFVANVLKSNGIKGIDTEKLYSVMKKPREQGVTEDTQSEDVDQITRDFVQHYENDPMGVFMHAKSSYLDAVGKAKHFSRKAAALYKSHANMSKQEFQDTVMKYFGKHLQNNGFPPHASEGWGKAEHELVKDLMNLDNQGVTEGQLNEKFKSQQQAKLMYAVAGNKDVSKKTGVSQKVAKEFIKKSHDQKVSQLPKKVKKTTEEIQTGGSKGLPFPGTYEQETNKFKYKGQRRTPTL